MGHTPLRNIRVSDELWQQAQQAAAAEGRTVTSVVLDALTALVRRHARKESK